MGRERDCTATIGGRRFTGRAYLEGEEIIFRSPKEKPRRIAIRSLRRIALEGSDLHLDDVILALGDDAAKWEHAIKNPKTRADKLGVKAGQKIAIVGAFDDEFLAEVRAITAVTPASKNLDLVFFAADSVTDLDRLPAVKATLAKAGAIWIVRPKGVKAITERDVMTKAKAAGLVDVKVVKFSETHTAEKVVIPVAERVR